MKAFITLVAAAGLLASIGSGNRDDGGSAQASQSAEKVKDPVCGMKIDQSTAKADEEYKGSHSCFCSTECRSKFKDAPDKDAT